MNKIVAIYCRVSTVEQSEEGYNIQEQERLLREYCQNNMYSIYKVYSDKGISGKSIDARPGIIALLNDADGIKYDLVLVWKIDRIARKTLDLLNMVDLLEKRNIGFRSYSENIDTDTITGKLLLQVLGSFGELERGTMAQNVRMGMLARAKEGRWNGGVVYGYDLIQKDNSIHRKRKDTELIVNDEESKVVKMIFKMYEEGNGYRLISNHLNRGGYTTKKGNLFTAVSVKDILTNPVYVGKIRYNVKQKSDKQTKNINPDPIIVDGIHKPIIEEELWNKTQSRLQSMLGRPSRIHDGYYLLTGILRCPVCGAGMVVTKSVRKKRDGTKETIEYYSCGAWKNGGTKVCHSNSIRVDKANEFVFAKLSKLLNNDKLIKDVVKIVNISRNSLINTSKDELYRIEKELSKIKAKKKKVFDAYEDEMISKNNFSERLELLSLYESRLQQEVNSQRNNVVTDNIQEISYEFIKSILSKIDRMIKVSSVGKLQKDLLYMIISKITINKARDIESIELHINNNLIIYLYNGGEPSPDGGGSPLSDATRVLWTLKQETLIFIKFLGVKTDEWVNE